MIQVIEYTPTSYATATPRDFPARPAHFRLEQETFQHYECSGPSFALHFTAAGRKFQAHLWFGERANGATKGQALAVLDSLEVEPI